MMKRRQAIPAAAVALHAAAQVACAQTSGSTHQSKDIWRLSVGSCANQKVAQPIWQTILSEKPDFHIFGGDNVYASDQPWSLKQLQEAYELAAKHESMMQLMHSVPYMAMWDDHDYGMNDAGVEFSGKQQSKQTLLDFFKYPATHATRSREGLYDSQIIGAGYQRIQIILLDTRWHRSPLARPLIPGLPGQERYIPDPSPEKTMLGSAQWQWLEAQLKQPAQIRLIFSGVQILAEGHGWERWGNFPLEKKRLLDLIAATKAQGVVLLSGDRHIGALYRETNPGAYPLWEMTSSGLTHAWSGASEAGPNRLGDLIKVNHYGIVQIDWAAAQVQLQLKDTQGRIVHAASIPMKELQA
jgi:alkaline phosphatase D